MELPVATYRLQLREGIDFDAAAEFLPHLVDLGLSHLYLSPIFTATPGSTHGYDITDPTCIDPALGGRAGFDRLSDAAQAAGIGLILDLVPNHTAFDLSNPWLADVLRHGRGSRFAAHFDIDWDEGPLVLPWLEQPFEALVQEGAVRRDGDTLRIGDLRIPLAPGSEGDDPETLHEAQIWRLVHWQRERDGVTHRRFFNVTGLIGMRVEDPAVFADMHALVVELAEQGRIQGLRIDHIDGLADPSAYLDLLRLAVGEMPIWVEKILTGDETLADWPVQGTTGYEAGVMIARLLCDADGAERLRAQWVDRSGGAPIFHEALANAKGDVIRRDLAAELRRLISLVRLACDRIVSVDPGDEALREAIIALLTAFPRYRTYFAGDTASPGDRALIERVADDAAEGLRARDIVDLIVRMIVDPQNDDEATLRVRFQQVTGALQAKAHEDTAGFRWTPWLIACEVGGDPDVPTASAGDLEAWAAQQPASGLILTSSHDTKRSEDARMRLAAWTHLPDAALALIDRAAALPEARGIPVNVQWYMVQSALAIWDEDEPDLGERLSEHAAKALREADEITSWTHPDADAEQGAQAFLAAIVADWRGNPPAPLARLIERGAILSLAQLAIKLMLPGIPDIYRGSEVAYFALTDPDNRRAADLDQLHRLAAIPGLNADKLGLLKVMLRLRHDHPGLFADGAFHADRRQDGIIEIRRRTATETLTLLLSLDGEPIEGGTLWPDGGAAKSVAVVFEASAGSREAAAE